MVNREVIEKWVTRLESGDYAQTKGKLQRFAPYSGNGDDGHNKIGFCCLGVLCDMAEEEGIVRTRQEEYGYVWYVWEDEFGDEAKEHCGLPAPVQEWAGLPKANPEFETMIPDEDEDGITYRTATVSLISMNDELDRTFPEIAGVLRENYL